MALPENFLMEIRARNDIESVVGSYVTLKRAGRNAKGLCPFHAEKTPSFTVYPNDNSFYCFGCGVGGDVITFTRKIENLDYIEAVRKLADRSGLTMPSEGYDDSLIRSRRRIRDINKEAGRFYYKMLVAGEDKTALKYITDRGISHDFIKKFGLGFAPDKWDALTKYLYSKGFTKEEITLADLGFTNKFGGVNDRYRNRLMFPIIDLQGNVIAFGGRDLSGESKAKYINTSDTLIYKKTHNLFALNLAKNTSGDTIILGEGYMDVISMHQAGFANAVASCGTALTQEQAMLISRYAKNVIIAYDADEAGQKAVKRSIPILRKSGINIKVLVVNSAKDPDEFIKKMGPAAFKVLLEDSPSDVDYLLNSAKLGHNIDTAEGKVSYLKAAIPILSSLESSIERDAYAGKLSQELSIDKNSILEQIQDFRRRSFRTEKNKRTNLEIRQAIGMGDKVNKERVSNPVCASAEDNLLRYIYNNQQDLEKIVKLLPPESMTTQFNRRIYQRLIELHSDIGRADITGFSSVFSDSEYGAAYKILVSNQGVRYTYEDAEIWIDIIQNENKQLSESEIASCTPDELAKLMQDIKKKKK